MARPIRSVRSVAAVPTPRGVVIAGLAMLSWAVVLATTHVASTAFHFVTGL